MGDRATVRIGPKRAVKRYATPAEAEAEAAWYQRVPWAAPKLLDVIGSTLVIQTHPVAYHHPKWRPAQALYELLTALHAEGIHHRDVHVKNIVASHNGPLLIDWETALHHPTPVSYDLYGPDASGIPAPKIHDGYEPQWWGSKQRMSIRNRWECHVPAPTH
jgi:hypothetical protein